MLDTKANDVTFIDRKQHCVPNNGNGLKESRGIAYHDVDCDISYEYNPPSIFVLCFTTILGIWGAVKTFFWAVFMGIFNGITGNRGFKKNFATIWYSFPNPKVGERMYPGSMIFYGMFAPLAEGVRRYSKSWRALEIVYRYRFGVDKSFIGVFSDWWCHHRTCESVRNRLKLSKKILRKIFMEIMKQKSSVNVLSIACGTAQGVIEVVSEFKRQGILINVTLVDYDKDALAYAKRLAKEYDVMNQFIFKRMNVLKKLESLKGSYDVIEVIGLLDYLEENDDNIASRFMQNLRKNFLDEEGYLLTANVLHNWDIPFVRFVINWWMIYRTPSEIIRILVSSGFRQEKVLLEFEPHKVHCVAICQNGPLES